MVIEYTLAQQRLGIIHAIPKRAFTDKAMLPSLRRLARASIKQ